MSGSVSVNWFIGIALFTVLAWLVGVRLGQRSAWTARLTIGLGVALMFGWGWLIRHPATAVSVIPVWLLSWIEGVGGVPLFMMILGAGWARTELPRQRMVIAWAMMFGTIYFVNGGMWMLQNTPTAVMGQSVDPRDIRQSQDYSCVPAACATALNLLGVSSTEMQMAELTQTRPGTGATMIRALNGLEQRLRGGKLRPVLVEPSLEDIASLPLPALTPLQYEATRRHMVVISRVNRQGFWIMDPMDGLLFFTFNEIRPHFRNQVILFESR
ncbi:MAG: cysteine peptidase family C39 domain-containing protein [Planctomycetota bacterium]